MACMQKFVRVQITGTPGLSSWILHHIKYGGVGTKFGGVQQISEIAFLSHKTYGLFIHWLSSCSYLYNIKTVSGLVCTK